MKLPAAGASGGLDRPTTADSPVPQPVTAQPIAATAQIEVSARK